MSEEQGLQARATTSSPTAASASARAHTWFVLTYLLGFESVRNYDGSWTEWGNAVRAPIRMGGQP
jgi:3-mercaptopyruvate sulfurtransferase SseA